MSIELEAQAFDKLCERLIREHGGNRELESAVIELEVAHKKHINTVKREFNANLDAIEKSTKEENERRARNAEEDAKFYAESLARVKADCDRQLAQASETYKRDLERVKSAYGSLLEDGKRRTSVVTQIHEDHARELKRAKDESDRIIGNKEKEIARLNRRLDDESLAARETLDEADAQRRALEDENATLRTKLQDSEVAREKVAAQHHSEMQRLLEQQESIIRTSTNLLNQFQNKSADLELELSKVRALMFDQDYQIFRAKLREEAFKNGASDVTKEMEMLDARKERERVALADVLARATKAKEDQQETLRQYQRDLDAEMAKLRAAQKLKEAKGANFVVQLPCGTPVKFKTQAGQEKEPKINANIDVKTKTNRSGSDARDAPPPPRKNSNNNNNKA
ncbi:putative kinesin [Leptomonas pyrrhocoris]|uniref:Putative kinesin n=1 Tax=Leptomonas pyrrhocoris TaxID=157538 RepID=A0A0M9G5N9_LEPPY|nr:putative kinesin [Leptomonas pyrrhocoris]XP_015661139.1 putative kinesin [Leptomonas pyrrhocoris]KPA82699.1 putative kinesin [Leptomonas pyrrhocoris]KPA82700.1 putative kinesin [Leptomonas pyrrhocoris]|eukprot:XP_015661138.1 putative kinesin [Leptomonas pyrrhocoris]